MTAGLRPEKKIPCGSLAEQISENVRRFRIERRLSYALITKRLDQIGRPIPVLGLRRIERGERRVDMDDLVALAAALGVPPIVLVFPAGQDPEVEVLPSRPVSIGHAYRWFIGADSPRESWSRLAAGVWSVPEIDWPLNANIPTGSPS